MKPVEVDMTGYNISPFASIFKKLIIDIEAMKYN